jgi:hypothetical protein
MIASEVIVAPRRRVDSLEALLLDDLPRRFGHRRIVLFFHVPDDSDVLQAAARTATSTCNSPPYAGAAPR